MCKACSGGALSDQAWLTYVTQSQGDYFIFQDSQSIGASVHDVQLRQHT